MLMAAVGFRPLGHDFNTKFNKTLERGSITEVFDGLCEMPEPEGGWAAWNTKAKGVPRATVRAIPFLRHVGPP